MTQIFQSIIETKKYQQKVLKTFENYFEYYSEFMSKAEAFRKAHDFTAADFNTNLYCLCNTLNKARRNN